MRVGAVHASVAARLRGVLAGASPPVRCYRKPRETKPDTGVILMSTAGGRLQSIHLLSMLPPDDLLRLEQACTWHRYRNGEQILDRTSQSRDVYFVVEGTVQIVNYSASGREVAYAQVPAGAFFGELSAVDGEPRSASAVAIGSVMVASMPPAAFQELLQRRPEVGFAVMKRLARIIRNADERIMDLATLGAVQRVQVELLRMAKPDPVRRDGWLIYPMPTQAQIASAASTTRETVARVLGQLENLGLIKRKAKTTFIEDRKRLEQYAERLATAESR
jgi:CRP/FNR family cyclic AMP-dependent transcriptional regulator